jgi:cell division protein FtsZ
VGEHEGDNAAYEAIKSAIESPLLDNMSINGAMGVLVHFHMHPEFPFMEITEAMEVVQESAHEDADVIFGTTTDSTIPVDFIRITLVATGFEKDLKLGVNNDDFVSEAPAQTQQTITPTTLRPRMVVGGDLSDDYLDVPTYMRQQKD